MWRKQPQNVASNILLCAASYQYVQFQFLAAPIVRLKNQTILVSLQFSFAYKIKWKSNTNINTNPNHNQNDRSWQSRALANLLLQKHLTSKTRHCFWGTTAQNKSKTPPHTMAPSFPGPPNVDTWGKWGIQDGFRLHQNCLRECFKKVKTSKRLRHPQLCRCVRFSRCKQFSLKIFFFVGICNEWARLRKSLNFWQRRPDVFPSPERNDFFFCFFFSLSKKWVSSFCGHRRPWWMFFGRRWKHSSELFPKLKRRESYFFLKQLVILFIFIKKKYNFLEATLGYQQKKMYRKHPAVVFCFWWRGTF